MMPVSHQAEQWPHSSRRSYVSYLRSTSNGRSRADSARQALPLQCSLFAGAFPLSHFLPNNRAIKALRAEMKAVACRFETVLQLLMVTGAPFPAPERLDL